MSRDMERICWGAALAVALGLAMMFLGLVGVKTDALDDCRALQQEAPQ